jgi:carbamoyl-phosphate synthase small subunit
VLGKLALEDGYVVAGEVFGTPGETWGEIVFNTSMTGYQEILTDPSYCGQIIVMTYPLIGNYGIAESDCEAKRSFARGLVVREVCPAPSNWHLDSTLDSFLKRQRLMGLSQVDTRALVRHIRTKGTMRAVMAAGNPSDSELVSRARSVPSLSGQPHVATVSPKQVEESGNAAGRTIVLVDMGAKRGISRELGERGMRVVSVPYSWSAEEILRLRPAGVLISNGPGDPLDVPETVSAVRALVQRVPVFGICLGHQVLGLAFGGKTYKLKFGHRGANHPVREHETGRVFITAQNHSYAVEPGSLPGDILVSHTNLNDGTVEGLSHSRLPAFSVQYHPEAAPGPRDSAYLFDRFMRAVEQAAGSGSHAP